MHPAEADSLAHVQRSCRQWPVTPEQQKQLRAHMKEDAIGQQENALYTPPCDSWMQPIEMVWAQIKKQAAMQSTASEDIRRRHSKPVTLCAP